MIRNPSHQAPRVPGACCRSWKSWVGFPGPASGPPLPAGHQVWSPGLTWAAPAALRPAWRGGSGRQWGTNLLLWLAPAGTAGSRSPLPRPRGVSDAGGTCVCVCPSGCRDRGSSHDHGPGHQIPQLRGGGRLLPGEAHGLRVSPSPARGGWPVWAGSIWLGGLPCCHGAEGLLFAARKPCVGWAALGCGGGWTRAQACTAVWPGPGARSRSPDFVVCAVGPWGGCEGEPRSGQTVRSCLGAGRTGGRGPL